MSTWLHSVATSGVVGAWEFNPVAHGMLVAYFDGTMQDGSSANRRLVDWVLTNQDPTLSVRVHLDEAGTASTEATNSFTLAPGESVGSLTGPIGFIGVYNSNSSNLTGKIRLIGTEITIGGGPISTFKHFIGNQAAKFLGKA